MSSPRVLVLMGSDSDWEVMSEAKKVLEDLGVEVEAHVSSAHRTPDQALEWAATASQRGMKVLIAAAGGAAHLGGVIAAKTLLPVLGVPMETKLSGGLDSLLSMVQMPRGVPVVGSSDAPVTHYAPLFGIEQALTRATSGGQVSCAFSPTRILCRP